MTAKNVDSLSADIRARSVLAPQAHGGEVALIALGDVRDLAQAHGVSAREVELAALQSDVMPARYLRNLGTVGWEGQAKLLSATVAVVGAGGLGGWIIEGLARMGVGKLIVIDADKVEENNLNRQLLADESSLGRPKAELAAERVRRVNSAVEVVAHAAWADAQSLPTLLAGVDVVVDALDTLPSRLDLQQSARDLGIPMVHGAIAGCTGQVMTVRPGDPGLLALYGDGPVPQRGLETRLGNPAATPMMISAWEIHEVVKLIVGTGELLCNRLLLLDAISGEVDILLIGEGPSS